ncbi:MAG: NAD(P)H-dependent glycerol-3-phosphate dehydrogenase [Bacteroidota bacterium]
MENSTKIAVIGGGSWATAIVKILCNNVDSLSWWVRKEEVAVHIRTFHHNPNYLQSVELDVAKINVSSDLHDIIKEANILVIATPSAFIDSVFSGIEKKALEGKFILSAVKGIVPETFEIPAHYFHRKFNVPSKQIGIVCGPCHAEEVALERLSYLTLASENEDMAVELATLFSCRYIKTSTSDDLYGTEFSAVLKNVYALAGGICAGLGYGDNFQAVLISNAIQEIERFIDVANPIHRDVKSSAYLGDLLVTAYSNFSRNRTFGVMIGKGYSVKSAQLEMNMIAEGYYAVKCVHEINKKLLVDLPIVDAVYEILYNGHNSKLVIEHLTHKLS